MAFHHAPQSLVLSRKEAAGSDQGKNISLAELCKESTPSKCQLNPLLFNGHLQTAWTAVKNDDVPVYYKRWTFESVNPSYSGSFEVDFVVAPYDASAAAGCESSDTGSTSAASADVNRGLPERTTFFSEKEFAALPSNDTKPMLVVLHGLSGGSHELYLRHTVQPLVQQGWEACVVNFRGCAQSKITSSILYNARATWDIRQFVRWAREKFPSRSLFGIGFSLGANILTNVRAVPPALRKIHVIACNMEILERVRTIFPGRRASCACLRRRFIFQSGCQLANTFASQYLGEEGDKCEFKAAVICSNPWNLELGSQALQRSWIGLEIYSRTMGKNMKRLFER